MLTSNSLRSFILITLFGASSVLVAQTGGTLTPQENGVQNVGPGTISLSPDPFDQTVTVRFHNMRVRGTVEVDLVDMRNGQVMLHRQVSPRNGLKLNTSDLVPGRYEVVVTETVSGRVVARTTGSRVVGGNVEGENSFIDATERSFTEDAGSDKSMPRLAFHAYPNPFSDHINLRFDSRKVQNMVQITLRSMQDGKVVLKELADPRQQVVIETSTLPKGRYILEVHDRAQGYLIGTMQMKN